MWGEWNPLMPMMMMQMQTPGYGPMKGSKGKGKGKGRGKGPYGKPAKVIKSEADKQVPNFKGKLNEYFAKKYKRQATAEEVSFTTEMDSSVSMYRTTLKINMMEDQYEITGDHHGDKKTAEHSASGQVLAMVDPSLHALAVKIKEVELAREAGEVVEVSEGELKTTKKKSANKKRTHESAKMPNFKGKLAEYIAKKYKRLPSAEELKYETVVDPELGLYRTTVRLNIGEDVQEAFSDGQPDKKCSEQAGAGELLLALSPELHGVAREAKEVELQRVADLHAQMDDVAAPGKSKVCTNILDNHLMDPKSKLNALLGKLDKRQLSKGDVVYTTNQVEGGFQTQCEITFRGEIYVGEVATDKKSAEKNAADIVVQSLRGELEA